MGLLHVAVDPFFLHELCVRAALSDFPVMDDQYEVRIPRPAFRTDPACAGCRHECWLPLCKIELFAGDKPNAKGLDGKKHEFRNDGEKQDLIAVHRFIGFHEQQFSQAIKEGKAQDPSGKPFDQEFRKPNGDAGDDTGQRSLFIGKLSDGNGHPDKGK